MIVKVKYFTTLRELAGTREEEFEIKKGSLLKELIELLSSKYGEEASKYLYVEDSERIDPSIKFLINGVDAENLKGFETPLSECDVVAIVPPIGGG